MILLEKSRYHEIYRLYQTNENFFPLIAAVLLDEQDGVVYVDNLSFPAQIYVEHSFGFAQVFGKPVKGFEQALERYLLVEKLFTPSKIRLYTPYLPEFFVLKKYDSLRSFRQRFMINSDAFVREQNMIDGRGGSWAMCGANAKNISMLDGTFGIVDRFWRSSADFIKKSHATIVLYNGEPASICYSAAEANSRVEIDVFTLPEYRNLGLAKLAVIDFVNRCAVSSLQPVWDCFTNNAGSMALCKSVGFLPASLPYPFLTISK